MSAPMALRLLEEDLQKYEFRIGAERGDWMLAQPVTAESWPAVFTWIRAAQRPGSPERLLVRWDLDKYGSQLPSGAFWDEASNNYLAMPKWPRGRAGSMVETVFKTSGWAAPGQGFYHPFDRKARLNHDNWPEAHPQYIWTKDNTLADFVGLVHRWLNCEDYLGCPAN